MSSVGAGPPVEISPLAVVDTGVRLRAGSTVASMCVIGCDGPDAPTVIGPGATIRSHTVIYRGNTIGRNFATGHHVLLREANTIGDGVSIGSLTVIEHHVEVGDRVRVHSQCFIPEYSRLMAGCWIGPRVTMTNAPYPRCAHVPTCLRGVVIECEAKIGANATILPGVRIGEGALIGAGAVVTRDVAPGAVVVGPAARQVKTIDDLLCPEGLDRHPYPAMKQDQSGRSGK